jgi:hypothetical protein
LAQNWGCLLQLLNPDLLNEGDVVYEIEVKKKNSRKRKLLFVPSWIRNLGLGNPLTLSVSIMNRRTDF